MKTIIHLSEKEDPEKEQFFKTEFGESSHFKLCTVSVNYSTTRKELLSAVVEFSDNFTNDMIIYAEDFFGNVERNLWLPSLLEQILISRYTFPKELLRAGREHLMEEMVMGTTVSCEEQDCIRGGITGCLYYRFRVITVWGNILIYSKEDVRELVLRGINIADVVNRARTLSNLPNNYLHQEELAEYAQLLEQKYHSQKNKLRVTILGQKKLKELNCGGILGVNQGSRRDAKLIVLEYQGGEGETIGLLGKGLMFDSGGYHLKSFESMDGMHYDMCGAANVLAVMELLVKNQTKINVMAIIPAVENLIGPEAMKMSDVITTMSGKTVEVVNTDAEGRLVLADAITYAVRQGCKKIVDLATLTYSCMKALGSGYSGVFSNNEALYEEFSKACGRSGEKAWRLPLDECYTRLLRTSTTADLSNYAMNAPAGGSIAAGFLNEFTENTPWLHIDMVGTAVTRSDNKTTATGVMIRSVYELFMLSADQ